VRIVNVRERAIVLEIEAWEVQHFMLALEGAHAGLDEQLVTAMTPQRRDDLRIWFDTMSALLEVAALAAECSTMTLESYRHVPGVPLNPAAADKPDDDQEGWELPTE
jgi:hypothetical protein